MKQAAPPLVTDAYHAASEFLAGVDADWAQLIAATGPCRLQTKPARAPAEALIRAIAYQQLHVKAGDAILGRLLSLYPDVAFPCARRLLATPFDTLRACGFSARKVETILAIAQASLDGVVPDLVEAASLDDEAMVRRLCTLKGIGRWTVEMFLIYTMQRVDILPVDDFGVRNGYRVLKRLAVAPSPRDLAALGVAWSPYRTVAAWYLWRVPEVAGS